MPVFSVLVAFQAMSATATSWTVIPKDSSISFSVLQTGQILKGKLETFNAKINFDGGQEPVGNVDISIDTKSFKTGIDEIDGQAQEDNWFATEKFPQARFSAASFTATGNNSYAAKGTLTIKGTTHDVTLPFTLKIGGDGTAMMQAQLKLSRAAYNIGTGAMADTNIVADEVTIDIAVKAKPTI